MASVPLLAAVGSWQLAAVMIFLERMGRATRNPPRDVMLAQAGGQMGLGWAFGINEGLDQLGALMGPLAVAALLASRHGYSLAFAALAIPATMTLLLVGSARVGFPYAGAVEHEPAQAAAGRYPRAFWWYCLGTGLVGFGYADYSLIAFHMSRAHVVPGPWIAARYR